MESIFKRKHIILYFGCKEPPYYHFYNCKKPRKTYDINTKKTFTTHGSTEYIGSKLIR